MHLRIENISTHWAE